METGSTKQSRGGLCEILGPSTTGLTKTTIQSSSPEAQTCWLVSHSSLPAGSKGLKAYALSSQEQSAGKKKQLYLQMEPTVSEPAALLLGLPAERPRGLRLTAMAPETWEPVTLSTEQSHWAGQTQHVILVLKRKCKLGKSDCGLGTSY